MGAKVAVLGGGGFRTPLVYAALLRAGLSGVGEFAMYDVDRDRLRLMRAVVTGLARECGEGIPVTAGTDPHRATDGADVVFCAVRVGGLAGRVADERVALDHGLLAQETTGPGGMAKALRTVPVTDRIARLVDRRAPRAWFVNFTNPAGLITEALRDTLGDRVVGVCDSPAELCRHVATALGRDAAGLTFDYVGLNHLGWLTGVRYPAGDLLPRLIADDAAMSRLPETHLFGKEWIREQRVIPNEYLAYHYFATRITARLRDTGTRGEYLLDQQRAFYATDPRDPAAALAAWRRERGRRSATYLAEVALPGGGPAYGVPAGREAGDRTPAAPVLEPSGRSGVDADGPTDAGEEAGGYGEVAAAFAGAALQGPPAVRILNVANRTAVPFLPADAVVEVPCVVTTAGPVPLAVGAPPDHGRELMRTLKEVERLTIRAARAGSAEMAVRAFARHPLVPTTDAARSLVEAYRAAHPGLRDLLT